MVQTVGSGAKKGEGGDIGGIERSGRRGLRAGIRGLQRGGAWRRSAGGSRSRAFRASR